MTNNYEIRIHIDKCTTPIRYYYIKAECLQEAINLCLYDVAQKFNIIYLNASKLKDDWPEDCINIINICNNYGNIVRKVKLSSDFYNT